MTKTQVSKAFFIVTDTKKLFQDSSPRFNYNSFNQLELTFPHISLWDSFDCMEYFCDEKPSVWWCIPSQIGTWRGIASWRIEFERETIASTQCGLSSCNSKLKLTWNMETEIETWTARRFTIFIIKYLDISHNRSQIFRSISLLFALEMKMLYKLSVDIKPNCTDGTTIIFKRSKR